MHNLNCSRSPWETLGHQCESMIITIYRAKLGTN